MGGTPAYPGHRSSRRRLDHRPGDRIRAEVQDGGSSWDGDLARSARPPHGLYLLLTLSARCGTGHGPRSRTTWFRLGYPPVPAANDRP